jgi:hypothetical protein
MTESHVDRNTGRPRRRRQAWSAVLLLIAASGCGGPTEPGILQIYYDPSLEIDIHTFTQTASGLFYKDVRVGTGALASTGSVVDFVLEGWFPTGQLAEPREVVSGITLGGGQVILGVDEGLRGMRAGGARKLVVPPDLAHGRAVVFVYLVELTAAR